ncbi:lysozyme C-1-like [Hyperolius riggenbachi]|uniref:lysozyme C-1-like n=1 Tax=Hyperolius riggenbachi TaxID=752182 RepID=UPI0035A2B53C
MMWQSLSVCALLFVGVSSTVYDVCTLYNNLENANLDGFRGYTLEDYLCLVAHASEFKTTMQVSPSDYGLFQISSSWWCDDEKTVGCKNMCGVKCQALLDDDISDDINCFARMLNDPNGIEAWEPWKKYCEGNDLTGYSKNCY